MGICAKNGPVNNVSVFDFIWLNLKLLNGVGWRPGSCRGVGTGRGSWAVCSLTDGRRATTMTACLLTGKCYFSGGGVVLRLEWTISSNWRSGIEGKGKDIPQEIPSVGETWPVDVSILGNYLRETSSREITSSDTVKMSILAASESIGSMST